GGKNRVANLTPIDMVQAHPPGEHPIFGVELNQLIQEKLHIQEPALEQGRIIRGRPKELPAVREYLGVTVDVSDRCHNVTLAGQFLRSMCSRSKKKTSSV